MAFAARLRAAIRASYLGDLAARFQALGRRLVVSARSFEYLVADALAVELEGLEAQAATMALEVFPDTASAAGKDHHGALAGLSRRLATQATLPFTVAGLAALTTYTLTGHDLVGPTGLLFAPTTPTVTTDGGGTAAFAALCQTAGAAGSHAAGTVCAWDTAPTGWPPTATTSAAPTAAGQDAETDDAYGARLLAWWKARPASGNRADWQAWALACDGVADAYVYPLMAPAGTPATPGCVTVCVVGPRATDAASGVPGDVPAGSNTRFPPAALATAVKGYIEGTADVHGLPAPTGPQLRPVTMAAGDYTVVPAVADPIDIAVQVVLDPSVAFGWAGTLTVDATSDATHLVVAGNQTALNGQYALVQVGSAAIRGSFQRLLLPLTGSFAGGKTTWTFAAPPAPPFPVPAPTGAMLAAPGVSLVYPAPGGGTWDLLRRALFDFLDALGPGVGPAVGTPSTRWPGEAGGTYATFYRGPCAGALAQRMRGGVLLVGVPGVLDAIVTTPAADYSPAANRIVDVGRFFVTA